MIQMAENTNKEKLLLVFLPFWTPYIPPQGITTLKAYLQKHGYTVKTEDINMNRDMRKHYNEYFNLMKQFIPYESRGNFFNVGHDVLYNHMMAHIHKKDEEVYLELVNRIIYQTYYVSMNNEQTIQLSNVLEELFIKLKNYLLNLIEKEKPTIFGSTAYSGTLPACLFAFKLVKEKFPEIKTIIGGGSFTDQLVIGTPNFKNFLDRTPYIDTIFIGQGQNLLLKWVQGKLPVKRYYTLADIDNETVPIESDADVPDLSEMPVDDYLFLASVGSKSCSYNCSFCNVRNFWGEHKKKNVIQTVNELELQYKKYNYQLFFLYDSLLNTIIDDLSTEVVKRDLPIYYVGYLRASEEASDIKNTIRWRQGGFYRARLGLESASQKILDMMNKKINPRMMKETLAALAYAGIQTTAYFVIGHPAETEEDFQMTLDLIEECKNDFWEVECNPFSYYYSNQNSQDEWGKHRKLVYPEYATDYLVFDTWSLTIEPQREETYKRMNRFVQFCDKLGIPNPYSVQDIYKADDRWKKLHKNAVPYLAELRDRNKAIAINESKKIMDVHFAENTLISKTDLNF